MSILISQSLPFPLTPWYPHVCSLCLCFYWCQGPAFFAGVKGTSLSKLSVYFTWHLYHPHRAQHFLLGIIIFPSPHLDCELWKSKGFLSLHQYLTLCLAHSRTTVNIFKWMNIHRWRCESRCQCYRWLDKSFNFIRP